MDMIQDSARSADGLPVVDGRKKLITNEIIVDKQVRQRASIGIGIEGGEMGIMERRGVNESSDLGEREANKLPRY